jgi:hypothetical protein
MDRINTANSQVGQAVGKSACGVQNGWVPNGDRPASGVVTLPPEVIGSANG